MNTKIAELTALMDVTDALDCESAIGIESLAIEARALEDADIGPLTRSALDRVIAACRDAKGSPPNPATVGSTLEGCALASTAQKGS